MIGPDIDLSVINKHRRYLERPELRKFVNEYLLTIYAGYLQADNRKAAMNIAAELYRYKGLICARYASTCATLPNFAP